jgi:hypothetical protein
VPATPAVEPGACAGTSEPVKPVSVEQPAHANSATVPTIVPLKLRRVLPSPASR